jgi:[acyl-carrier-protein] S-malonyltransferase
MEKLSKSNNKKILVFPGQGSQYAGMSKELCENFTKSNEIYECGSDILGYDLKTLMFDGDEVKLANTEFSQPAIFAASLVALTCAQESGIFTEEFNPSAGHSLGEYAALVACGVFDIENGFKAIKARGRIMAKAGQANPGGMAAVIGATAEQVGEVCEEADVTLANHNSPVQCVIAGEISALDKAEELLKQKDIRRLKFVRLKVSAAFHTPLMSEAAEEFLDEARSLTFNKPKADFYSNVYAAQVDEITPQYLSKHIVSSVRFVPQLEKILRDGYNTFIEVGPGKVLSGLISKTLNNVNTFNIEDMQSLEKCKS